MSSKTKDSRSEKRRSSKAGTSAKVKSLAETVVAVFPDGRVGKKALAALQSATEESAAKIERIPFEKLDFGDLKALDKFYSAPVVVVDVTERQYEACLFYQIGLRESFGMKHNVVMCMEQESSFKTSFGSEQVSPATSLGVSLM